METGTAGVSLTVILIICGVFTTFPTTCSEGNGEVLCKIHVFVNSILPNSTSLRVLCKSSITKKEPMYRLYPQPKNGSVHSVNLSPKIFDPWCTLELQWKLRYPTNKSVTLNVQKVLLESCIDYDKHNSTYLINQWVEPNKWMAVPLSISGERGSWSYWSECSERNIRNRSKSCARTRAVCPSTTFECPIADVETENCTIDRMYIIRNISQPTDPPPSIAIPIIAGASGFVVLVIINVLVCVTIYCRKKRRKRNGGAIKEVSGIEQPSTKEDCAIEHCKTRIANIGNLDTVSGTEDNIRTDEHLYSNVEPAQSHYYNTAGMASHSGNYSTADTPPQAEYCNTTTFYTDLHTNNPTARRQ